MYLVGVATQLGNPDHPDYLNPPRTIESRCGFKPVLRLESTVLRSAPSMPAFAPRTCPSKVTQNLQVVVT